MGQVAWSVDFHHLKELFQLSNLTPRREFKAIPCGTMQTIFINLRESQCFDPSFENSPTLLALPDLFVPSLPSSFCRLSPCTGPLNNPFISCMHLGHTSLQFQNLFWWLCVGRNGMVIFTTQRPVARHSQATSLWRLLSHCTARSCFIASHGFLLNGYSSSPAASCSAI